MKLNWKTALLALSGLIPLLGLSGKPPDVMLLIYTVFVAAGLVRPWLAKLAGRIRGPLWLPLLVFFQVSGALTESLAWANNYLKAAKEPALFHPQLFGGLIVGIGFYGGWAAAWWVAFRWFRFQLWETFVITGLQGIFFEQLGAAFVTMIRTWPGNPMLAVLMGFYVFAVHGSAVGLALVPVLSRFDDPGKSRSWVRFPAVVALMIGLAFVGCWLVQLIASLFGGLPPKRSITEHPFW